MMLRKNSSLGADKIPDLVRNSFSFGSISLFLMISQLRETNNFIQYKK